MPTVTSAAINKHFPKRLPVPLVTHLLPSPPAGLPGSGAVSSDPRPKPSQPEPCPWKQANMKQSCMKWLEEMWQVRSIPAPGHLPKKKLAEGSAHPPTPAYTKSTVNYFTPASSTNPCSSCSVCCHQPLPPSNLFPPCFSHQPSNEAVIAACRNSTCETACEKGRKETPRRSHAYTDLHIPQERTRSYSYQGSTSTWDTF